jgi:hypothetical protein
MEDRTMRPLGIATWILAAMALFILWGAAHAEYSLLPESAKSSLDRCYRRCEKNNPPLPSPEPTHSPKPLPCEPIGGVKTFVEGEPRMFCFDIAAGGSALVEVASTTPANVGCSYFQSQLTAPDGSKSNTDGAYPMGVARRMPGRYYFWVQPIKVGAGLCNTYSFTVSK